MSGEALYERYKDALKRGHIAALRGKLEDALVAYAEAAGIAPERATPHTSAGTVLVRAGRPEDALRHYSVALRLAPRDEAALLGRAQALAALERPGEAADAYDAVAEARLVAGRLSDAVDAARRALELAEGRARRRILAQLIDQLRASEPDEPGRRALDRALQVLDGVAMIHAARSGQADASADEQPTAGEGTVAGSLDSESAAEALPEPPEAAAPPAVPVIRAALDRIPAEGMDADALLRTANEAIDAADPRTALDRLLDLAAVHRRGGHTDAALDACYSALALVPDDMDVHLALVELYADRGWGALAVEKLDLLERIAELDADDAADPRTALDRLLDLAAVHRRGGHTDAALDACYSALALVPDDMDVHLALVELYADRGWGALAVEKLDLLERIAGLDADDGALARVSAARTVAG